MSQKYIKNSLKKKIESHKAKIGIIGLGYVGLPLVIRFAEENFRVFGFDVDDDKIKRLNAGESYIRHIPAEKLRDIADSGQFTATSDFDRLSEADCVLICVPTPLDERREPDMRYVDATTYKIATYLRQGQLISLESTTYPGTTREILLEKLNTKGLQVGLDYFLAYSPEREDPGNTKYTTKVIPKVVGGVTPDCTDIAYALYNEVVDSVIRVSSPEVAEFTKLLENIFRAVNIALVNEMKILADKMGVDVWEIIGASATKPFGYMPFYPGPGLGGHCIPIDPFYLAWKAKEYGVNMHFIELAGEVNTSMPQYVISRLGDALNERGKCYKGSKVLILGAAYKSDTDDLRESPSLLLIELLRGKGVEVFYNDPYIERIPAVRKYDLDLASSPLSESLLKSMDAVLIATAHSAYDYEWIVKNSRLVIDTRNATGKLAAGLEKIKKA
jgi:UDP-N-acetyl-D-glucosamine dehydrogenase